MDMSLKEYMRSLPGGSFNGEVLVGDKKTTKYVVDANTGKLIRVHHTPSSKESWDSIIQNAKLEISGVVGQQLSFTRTDYLVQSFAANSEKVLWNVTVADIDVTLFCEKNANSVMGPSPSPSESGGNFNMPLFCGKKALVHRLRSPYILDSFRLAEHRVPQNDLEPLSSTDQDLAIQNLKEVNLVTKTRIVFSTILLIAICSSVSRLYNKMVAKLKNRPNAFNAEPSSSEENHGREDENAPVDVENVSPLNLMERDIKWRSIGKLDVSSEEIGKGSNGTVVFKGRLEGREVAVKRLVSTHNDVAKEIGNYIYSKQHPNVVCLYGLEWDQDFVYLALEHCTCSLYDLIQHYAVPIPAFNYYERRPNSKNDIYLSPYDYPSSILLKLMRNVVSGLVHLHDVGIIHRDLKPHNVLILMETSSLCGKLTDMGISRILDGGKSSLGSNATGSGSSGWKAPEQLRLGRQTRAVDLFSLGCVLFFCITCGRHPFGEQFHRDANVLENRVDLSLVEHIPEAVDLISQLLSPDAALRPKASKVLHHPLFWGSERRLLFLCEVSDRVRSKDGRSIVIELESKSPVVFDGNWNEKIESPLHNLRHYNYESVRSLLRFMRDYQIIYKDLPTKAKKLLGSGPEGFDRYFRWRFPKLLMEVYNVVYHHCKEKEWFHKYL